MARRSQEEENTPGVKGGRTREGVSETFTLSPAASTGGEKECGFLPRLQNGNPPRTWDSPLRPWASPRVPLPHARAAVPYLYPTLREKCRQASFRWVSKFARRKFPPHSGQTWGGRFLCIR